MKKRDFEPKLQPFLKVFEKLTYQHEVYQVFQDFILICLNWFGNGNFAAERDARIKTYKPQEHHLFNLLFEEMIKLQAQEITTDNSWYDPFGNFYQAITSNWKASAMGQFFTPDPVINIMVQIIHADRGKSKMMFCASEPAAGSGRFVIAQHAHNTNGFYWAIDLDPLCAQMTAVNMALHNCSGVVLHANGLWEEKEFFRAYHIARIQIHETTFVPCIYPIATYEEAKSIMSKYQEFVHTNNMAYHFREYMGLKLLVLFNEEKAVNLIEESFHAQEAERILSRYSEINEQPIIITPEIKEVIKTQVKNKNKNIQDNQLSLF